jgi:PadR family transcriptional regulator PadR
MQEKAGRSDAFLIYRKIYAYSTGVRRKSGTLLPIEISILETAIDLRRRGEEEFHGFAVAKEIAERDEARTLTAHGTLYKALERMQRAGLLESRWEDPEIAATEARPRRRLYHVTGLGAQALVSSDAIPQPRAVKPRGGLAPS